MQKKEAEILLLLRIAILAVHEIDVVQPFMPEDAQGNAVGVLIDFYVFADIDNRVTERQSGDYASKQKRKDSPFQEISPPLHRNMRRSKGRERRLRHTGQSRL